MKLSLLRWMVGALLALVGAVLTPGVALAADSDFILSFDPPEMAQPSPAPAIAVPPDPDPDPDPDPISVPDPEAPQPLPIPAHAMNPPMRFHSPQQLPSGVNRQVVAVAIDQGATPVSILPPAPPRLEPLPPVVVATAAPAVPEVATPQPQPAADQVALAFTIAPLPESMVAQAEPTPPPAQILTQLFEGGSHSLVARAVGSAEGTRTPSGEITPAYYGHTDPGNRAWNMGTFSYQHGATSATEADQKQLQRLQSQTDVLKRRALKQGLTLTLEETLNGIDLANQSPLAAMGRVGYIERLAEVKQWGLTGSEAIVVARTRSYLNPNTGRWNAPGLGNTEASITRDQRRRATAIAQALESYRQDQPSLVSTLPVIGPPSEVTPPQPVASAPALVTPPPATIAIQVWPEGSESPPSSTVAVAPGAEPSINPGTSSTATWAETREANQTRLAVEASALTAATAADEPAVSPPAPALTPGLASVESGLADSTALSFPTAALIPGGDLSTAVAPPADALAATSTTETSPAETSPTEASTARFAKGKLRLKAAIAPGWARLAPLTEAFTPATATPDSLIPEPLTPEPLIPEPSAFDALTPDRLTPDGVPPASLPPESSNPESPDPGASDPESSDPDLATPNEATVEPEASP